MTDLTEARQDALDRAEVRRQEETVAAHRLHAEQSVDKFARAFAHRYGIEWSEITPDERDRMREQTEQLLTYIDSTAFRGFLPVQGSRA